MIKKNYNYNQSTRKCPIHWLIGRYDQMITCKRHARFMQYAKFIPVLNRRYTLSPLMNDIPYCNYYGTCVKHVAWCMPVSLTSGFLLSRWQGKRSRHSRRMRNLQFCVSGKRPMTYLWTGLSRYMSDILSTRPDVRWSNRTRVEGVS